MINCITALPMLMTISFSRSNFCEYENARAINTSNRENKIE